MDVGTEWSNCGQHHQSLVAVAYIRKNNSVMIMEVQRLRNGYEVPHELLANNIRLPY
jgi:hypothetical protein